MAMPILELVSYLLVKTLISEFTSYLLRRDLG